MSEKMFVVHGAGGDKVGLVERIASAIADVQGNIIDLRQDVLQGLFTIYLVADFSHTDMRLEKFQELVRSVAEATGLELHAAPYRPGARQGNGKNLLLILLGGDRPGIISRVCKDLSSHRINIEYSRTCAREGVFLMELLTDISQSTLPVDNLEGVVRETMASVGINSMFQQKDVFNPRKRIILFNIKRSFIAAEVRAEIMAQTGLATGDLPLSKGGPLDVLGAAAFKLENLPVDVLEKIVEATQVAPGTVELIHSLKRMGYRVALASTAFAPLIDDLKKRLGLDHAYGTELSIDDDSRTILGTVGRGGSAALETERVLTRLTTIEGVERSDISILGDGASDGAPPAVRIEFPMRLVLDYFNQKILSRDALTGVLGAFGLLS